MKAEKKTTEKKPGPAPDGTAAGESKPRAPAAGKKAPVPEIGGRDGPDPTRYGDWEKNGRCIDF